MFLTGSNRTTTPLVSQLNIAVEKDLPVASRFSLLKMTKELLSRWFDQLRMLSFTGLLRKVPKMCDSRLINVGIRCALAFTSLILLFFAVRNISRILDVERSDAVVVKAEIRNNVTVKLPEPTMCLQVDIRKIDTPVSSDDPAKVRELLSLFDKDIGEIIASYPDKIAARVATAYDLTALRPLIALTAAMLADIVRVENSIHMQVLKDLKLKERYAARPLWGSGESSLGHQESMEAIYKFYSDKKIDFTEVIKATGALMCSLAEVRVSTHAWHSKTYKAINLDSSPCYKGNITWVGTQPLSLTNEEFVCFKVSAKYSFTFMYGTANTRVSLKPQNFYEGFDMNDTTRLSESGFVDFNGYQVVDAFHLGWLGFPYLKGTTVDVSIVGDHRALNTRSNPCSNVTGVTCRLVCRANNIIDKCSCFPISAFHFSKKPVNLPFCSDPSDRQNYDGDKFTILKRTDEACLLEVAGNHFYPVKCTQTCQMRKCEQLVLDMKKSVRDLEDEEQNRTFLEFEVYRHNHYLMREVYQSDTDEFTTEMSQSVSVLLLLAIALFHLTKSAYQLIFIGESDGIKPVRFHNQDTADTSEEIAKN